MLLNKLLNHVYMDVAGEGSTSGGSTAPAPAATTATPAATAPAITTAPVTTTETEPVADDGLKTPESLFNDKTDDAPKPPETEAPKPNEPIVYTDFTLPEGINVDAAKIGDFKTIASELGIPQEGAQKIIDLYTAELKQSNEAPLRAWNELQTKWRNEVINDPEIGGANLEKNLSNAKVGLENLMGDVEAKKFFDALNVTGAGNNPDIIRGLFKAAQSHAPASPVSGTPGSPSSRTAGQVLYPQAAGLGNGYKS
jgi:hypothetical protein